MCGVVERRFATAKYQERPIGAGPGRHAVRSRRSSHNQVTSARNVDHRLGVRIRSRASGSENAAKVPELMPAALGHQPAELRALVGEEEEGVEAAHSWPMNSSGVCGATAASTVAAR